jgi:putative flippase GtrA
LELLARPVQCLSLAAFWLIISQYPQFNLIAKAIGYITGFFVGFTLNKFWTYIDQAEDGEKVFAQIYYGVWWHFCGLLAF